MQHAEIRDALLSADPPSEALLESIGQNSTQLDLLSAVARIYEHQGVIVNGCARQLCTSCDANAGCWREIRQSRPNAEPRREDRGIAFPFIGPGYRAGGVVTIAINFRRDSLDHGGRESGLHSGFKIAREQLSALDRGRKPRFAWDVSGVLALVLYSSRRAELPDPVGRDRRIEAVRATARLQAVKCSPLHQFVNRSKPSHAMEKECPPRYLVKEIQALAPSVLVCFGRAPRQALARLGATGLNDASIVGRGRFTLAGSVIDVIAVPHPSAFGRFKAARSRLKDELAECPAGARPE